MDLDETMVDEVDDIEADDTPEEDVVEEEEDSSEDLDSIQEEEESAEEQPKQEPTATEPGYVKRRIEKAVQRAVAETEARMQAQFDAQMAPIRDRLLTDEAKELVKSGEFKSLERAKEYLQLKQGVVPKQEQAQQPRNDKGQFTPKEDPAQQAVIGMLAKQANKIRETRGIDVMEEFNRNPEIKRKIIDGEMDFYDVAEVMAKAEKRKPPSPMRSPNGASGHVPNSIENMTDKQFELMEKRIKEGKRYKLT